MTQHTDIYTSSTSVPAPTHLISASVSVTGIGGGSYSDGIIGFVPAVVLNGAYISGQVPASAFPLTIVIGQRVVNSPNGGAGYSGGGTAPAGVTNMGPNGGGGSTAVLSAGALLMEAGGADGAGDFDISGGSEGDPGGTGGGYASNTPTFFMPNYSPGVTVTAGAGSGGSQGGNGGAANTGAGGSGAGGGTNGNAASGATSGAGVGSGGLAVSQCGSCFAASTVSGTQYGKAPTPQGSVALVYNTADAPSPPLLVTPGINKFLDVHANGVTLVGTYQTPGADTGSLSAVAVSLKIDGGTVHYWNGTDFSSTSAVWLTPDTGVGSASGQQFSVIIPPSVLNDGHTFTWGLACQESFASLQGSFSATQDFIGQVAPTAVVTSPTSTTTTLTPNVTWTPTTPAGSQTAYAVKIFAAPVSDPGSASGAIYGAVGTTATTFAVPSGYLHSVDTYYGYLAITETGGQTSAWIPFVFTVQLVDSAVPVLTGAPVSEPTTGAPCAQLTGTTSGGTASPSIRFQVSSDGANWSDVVGLGPANTIATSLVVVASGSASIYDLGAPCNIPLYYRARNEAVSAGETHVSDWSNVVTLTVPSDYWWVSPPSDLSMSVQLSRLQSTNSTSVSQGTNTSVTSPTVPQGLTASLVTDEPESQGRFNGFGTATSIVVHGDIWAEEFVLNAYFASEAQYQAFRDIRNLKEVVLLRSDMNGEIYWVNFGPVRPAAILSESGRRVATKRGLSIQCIPADPVAT